MALMQNYTADYYGVPVVFDDAYYKVDTISGTKDLQNFCVLVYKTSEKITQIDMQMYQFVPDLNSTENFIAQAYSYLKTLPEYANAIDC